MKKESWKYRRKGDRIVIECDREYKLILPKDPEQLYNAWIMYVASQEDTELASLNEREKEQEESQKFG